VALMASTVVFTLSRGGCLALVAGVAVCLLASRWRRAAVASWTVPVLLGGLVLFFLAWLGLPLVEARLRTLGSSDTLDSTRMSCWSRVLPVVTEFPCWGTGLGTFQW